MKDKPWCNNCGGDLVLLTPQPEPKPKFYDVALCNKCGRKELTPTEN